MIAKLVACVCLLFVAGPSFAQVGKNAGLVNPNLASEEQLAALPHIDKAQAALILEQRPFLGIQPLHALLAKDLSEEESKELYGKMFLPINLNTAGKEELALIPGVGKRMIHEFEEYRPYKSLAQFRREIAKYVDEQELARLEQYVFVPLDLNTASSEDLQTIPGMGPRMIHEFEEYRPYKALAQFRREMGKYVDEKEVARLERYVFIAEPAPDAGSDSESDQ